MQATVSRIDQARRQLDVRLRTAGRLSRAQAFLDGLLAAPEGLQAAAADWPQFGADPEAMRPLVELAFRERLLAISEARLPQDGLQRLLDTALLLAGHGVVDPSLPAVLMEDYMDTSPAWGSQPVLGYLQQHMESLGQDVSSARGRGLVLLRLCNELIRRTPKASEAAFCGEILLFLSKLFPSGERSGVNLRGNFNLDNVTLVEPAGPAAGDRYSLDTVLQDLNAPDGPPYAFYRDFWRLQFFYLHPAQALQPDNWRRVMEALAVLCGVLEKTRFIEGDAVPDSCPKFMSSRRLLSLQLADLQFRRVTVIQALLFASIALGFSPREELRMPAHKDADLLTPEMEAALGELTRRLGSILAALPGGRHAFRLIRWVQRNEKNWVCPRRGAAPAHWL